jgi:MFS family permease
MSMPQVHIVALCSDLGFAAARGAEMLSLMLGFGIVSRLTFGWISDRIGGLRTLLLGSTLQAVALALFLPAEGLVSLYVVSAMFGLFQGGIVPSYAIIVREYFDPRVAGTTVSIVLTATLFGMALGGWMSGAIFDLTGLLRRRLRQRHRLEPAQHGDRRLAPAARPETAIVAAKEAAMDLSEKLLRLKPDAMGKDEWEVRLELAALYRAFDWLGWTESIYNHITARVPGASGTT